MKISELNYNLPKELIASIPARPRDHSRLLVADRESKQVKHRHFYDILDYLKPGDVLVLNDTRVLPARVKARKITPEGKPGRLYRILLVKKTKPDTWECLIEGKKRRLGQKLLFPERGRGVDKDLRAEIVSWQEGNWGLKFNKKGKKLDEQLFKLGETPLPPYIKSKLKVTRLDSRTLVDARRESEKLKIEEQYQTIYAKKLGSVAAPTAGFHFTQKLLDKIRKKGILILCITLHVGPGTFLPITEQDVRKHKMHSEFFEIKKDVWNEILKAKKEKRKIIAIGTTTCRVLETMIRKYKKLKIKNKKYCSGTNLFIYPPYKFKIVDALITNFHLPKTTLLALVAAFLAPRKMSGIKLVKNLYKLAIKKKYRFYSFGDAMYIK